MNPTPYLIIVLILALATLLWLLSLRRNDASIADIAWAPGFAVVTWAATAIHGSLSLRGWLILILVNVWAVRLSRHIWRRHDGEDRRYAAMRAKHGARWWWQSLFQVFWLQALLCWLISWPLQLAVTSTALIGLADIVGMLLAVAGLLIEAIADTQLAQFRSEQASRGQVMDRGLWRWSRHPNYFGDALMWWGYFLIGFAPSGGWWTIFCPITMTFLLLRVSGVSLLEETITERRPGYAEYIRRTSAFIPLPPK